MTTFRAGLGAFGLMWVLALGLHATAIQKDGATVAQPPASSVPAAAPATGAAARGLIDQYCVSCHNDRLRTAGLSLSGLNADDPTAAPEIWEKVVQKLRAGAMPPPRLPRPEPAAVMQLVARVETALDAGALASPNPGAVPIHRLNRAEYANAIRDLLALEVDTRSLLPADDIDAHGFDNNAGVLSVSPALLERYVSSARKIGRLAVGDPAIVPGFETYPVAKMMLQDERMSEDLPFGSRGGLAVRHTFPLDGTYIVKVRLQRQLYDYIRGLGEPHRLDVRIDGTLMKRFTVGGEATGMSAPVTFAGNIPGDRAWEDYMHEADANLELRAEIKAGPRTVGVSFVEEPRVAEDILQPRASGFTVAVDELWDGNPAIESVSIGGPHDAVAPRDTASRRKIFVCQPSRPQDEPACVTEILSSLVYRAYRRPSTPADLEVLRAFYEKGRPGGFDAGVQRALERVLVDPEFLFRIERTPAQVAPETPHRLSEFELASRLSFFLWSSVPDQELLDLAGRGKLSNRATLEQQVQRMLVDSRSQALVDNFSSQWLGVRSVRGVTPDPDLFPEFDDNLREAFLRETGMFVDSQLRENHPAVELLTANYTFVNERLARHYGIPGVYGERFRRVTLPDARRGGLLGQGSILTATSYPNRTSPVLRGKWVLDNLLGSPPPPPPPDVPALVEKSADGRVLSVRERMEQHRKNPACATCHVRMDPLGFALENFDAIGQWRGVSEAGTPIDASDVLIDGTRVNGMGGLRQLVLDQKDQFVRVLTEKLLSYALGRGIEFYDLPAVRRIERDAAPADYRWSSLILGVVNSVPFQMRRAGE